jgi:hypothetical protein
MAKVRVNFGGNDDDGFQPLPAGDYDAVVFAGELKEGTEFPYFNWTFKVTEEEFENRQVFLNTSTSPKAVWRLTKMFEAIGYEPETEEGSDDADIDIDEVVGLPCVVRLTQKEYEGKMRNEVKSVLAPGTKSKKGGSRF